MLSYHILVYMLLDPPPTLAFLDQFANRPTDSTSAAIISLLHTIIIVLQCNPFVVIILMDFSKALIQFDTQLYCLSWLNSTSWPLSKTDWWISTIATRIIPCSTEMSRAQEAL